MQQRCYLVMVWLTWIGLPLLGVLVGLRTGVAGGLAVLVVGILAQVLYVRWLPHVSRSMRYRSVAETPASVTPAGGSLPDVTLYTASICPFCRIVRRRLAELEQQAGFRLQEIDVTFRRELVREKGLRSIPVLEAKGHFLFGNVTSAQLLEFLNDAATDGR